jgi:hypothetical protein
MGKEIEISRSTNQAAEGATRKTTNQHDEVERKVDCLATTKDISKDFHGDDSRSNGRILSITKGRAFVDRC